MIISRRSLIGAGLVLAAAGMAGCSKAVQTALTPTTVSPVHPTMTAYGTSSASAGSAVSAPSSNSSAHRPSTDASSAAEVSARKPPSGPAVEIANGPRDKSRVALTFHGAGDLGLARQILSIAN